MAIIQDAEDPPMQLTPCVPCQTCVWSGVEKALTMDRLCITG